MDQLKTLDYSSILDALEVDKMEPEEQKETMIEIVDLVFRGTMLKIMEQMSDEDKEGLFALEDTQAPEEKIAEYIEQRIPNSDNLVLETLQELQDDILAVTKG